MLSLPHRAQILLGRHSMDVLTMVISAMKERFMVPRKRIIGGIVNKFKLIFN